MNIHTQYEYKVLQSIIKYFQWITNGIIKSIKYSDNLYNQLKRLNPIYIEHFINKVKLKIL